MAWGKWADKCLNINPKNTKTAKISVYKNLFRDLFMLGLWVNFLKINLKSGFKSKTLPLLNAKYQQTKVYEV
jgi:hypothetical protein